MVETRGPHCQPDAPRAAQGRPGPMHRARLGQLDPYHRVELRQLTELAQRHATDNAFLRDDGNLEPRVLQCLKHRVRDGAQQYFHLTGER